MSDARTLQDWARAVLAARAELEAFDLANAGTVFKSKGQIRRELVASIAYAELQYTKARLPGFDGAVIVTPPTKPRDPNAGPLATPEEASAAVAQHGSERKAAAALAISRTQLRRLLGKQE